MFKIHFTTLNLKNPISPEDFSNIACVIHKFKGTLEKAREKAKEINSESFSNSFSWFITQVNCDDILAIGGFSLQ